MLLIISLNVILIPLVFIIGDLMDYDKGKKALKEYCKIECRAYISH